MVIILPYALRLDLRQSQRMPHTQKSIFHGSPGIRIEHICKTLSGIADNVILVLVFIILDLFLTEDILGQLAGLNEPSYCCAAVGGVGDPAQRSCTGRLAEA